jgi:hypothetical protein
MHFRWLVIPLDGFPPEKVVTFKIRFCEGYQIQSIELRSYVDGKEQPEDKCLDREGFVFHRSKVVPLDIYDMTNLGNSCYVV